MSQASSNPASSGSSGSSGSSSVQGRPAPPPMKPKGSETPQQRALREWFERQRQGNMMQIEEGARQVNQLVTAMFGVMFAVLAFGDSPDLLQLQSVKILGTLTIFAYFIALLASLDVLYPWANAFFKNNLTDMRRTYDSILARKVRSLRIAMGSFTAGTVCLGMLLLAALWGV